MRWYWTKIAIGALAVFGVGIGILSAVRSARSQIHEVAHSASDLSLPLPFVSFNFDGAEAGKFRRLVLRRSDPRRLSGIDLTVRVSDQTVVEKLQAGCHLTVDDARQLTSNTSFRCVEPGADLRSFGEVTVLARGESGDWMDVVRVPLLLPEHVVSDLDGSQVTDGVLGAEVDEIQALADSIRSLSLSMATASDAERVELTREMAELRMELREIERAVAEVARTRIRTEIRAAMPAIKVKVAPSAAKAPEAPTPPPSR